MHVLVINAGSSSVKFTLFSKSNLQVVADGLVERIGLKETRLSYRMGDGSLTSRNVQVTDTRQAVALIADLLLDNDQKESRFQMEIAGIGHRVVHGGEWINRPVIIDSKVKQIIKDCFDLAPLHNPPNLSGIEACEDIFPDIAQVAVFDTAFHASIPEHAFLYGLPFQFYREDKIRRYGFHGTSHQYVSRSAAEFLNRPIEELKTISCHLGNGCSITAVDGGNSIDTSMGFTPLEGLVMGTRCGDIDPAIIFYLMSKKHLTHQKVNELLNKKSGLLGLAETESSDLRDIFEAQKAGKQQADTAVEVFTYRIKKYIGAYVFALGGVDTIVFTAGIGENAALVRELTCRGMDRLGIVLDPQKNSADHNCAREIQHQRSKVKILVIPTNEEKEIADQTLALLSGGES